MKYFFQHLLTEVELDTDTCFFFEVCEVEYTCVNEKRVYIFVYLYMTHLILNPFFSIFIYSVDEVQKSC